MSDTVKEFEEKNLENITNEEKNKKHKIICGDCLFEFPKIANESVDLIIADPPFNVRKKYNSYKDNKSRKEYIEWCHKWLIECIRVMKDGSALYLINYPENNAYLVPFLDEKLTFKRWMTWHYPTNTGMSPTNFTRSQHAILFYIKGEKPRIFNKNDIAVPYKNENDKRIQKLLAEGSPGRTPYDVFHINIVKNVSKDKTDHPCQIPIKLLEIFIKASSNKGDLVLDPFGGSFSTMTACHNLDRKSISIELDETYCNQGIKRLEKLDINRLNFHNLFTNE